MQTGPRTAQGKAASSMNATTHGLTSNKVVLPGEDSAAYDRLLTCLFEDNRPGSAIEALLVEEMAQAHWRLNRVRYRQDQAMMSQVLDTQLLALLHRYATGYERTFFKSLETLKKLQRERLTQLKPTFVSQIDEEAFSRAVLAEMTAPHKPPVDQPEDGIGATKAAA